MDATHTKDYYNPKKPREVLRERSKALRKTIYQYSKDIKAEFPSKPQEDNLEAELSYTQALIEPKLIWPILASFRSVLLVFS